MNYLLSTGQAAMLLDTTEPRLAHTVRIGKIRPEPAIVAGRRQWTRDQVLQAAKALKVDMDAALSRLDAAQEAAHVG